MKRRLENVAIKTNQISKKRILVLGNTRYEGGERRWTFPIILAEMGYQVILITNLLPHEKFRWRPILDDMENLTIVKVPTLHPLLPWKGMLSKTLIRLSYTLSLIIALPFIGYPQIVLSMGPHPYHDIFAYFIKKLKKSRLFLDVSDVERESLSSLEVNKIIYPILDILGLISSNFIYRISDGIIVHNKSIGEIVSKYTDKRIYVVHSGVDLDVFYPMTKREACKGLPELYRSFMRENRFIVLYAGLHGPIQDLSRILKAAWILKENKGIFFVFVGEGEEKDKLIREAMKYDVDNVLFMGYQPWSLMPYVINIADVVILPYKARSIWRIGLPKKFFEYAACGKPIICLCPPGEVTHFVNTWKAGVAVNPNNPEELAIVISNLYKKMDLVNNLGKNSRMMAEKMFSFPKIGIKLNEIFQ